jgi:hypothetical protein
MKFAAWCACWPLLGVMWFAATLGDSMCDIVEMLDGALDSLGDYIESEDA